MFYTKTISKYILHTCIMNIPFSKCFRTHTYHAGHHDMNSEFPILLSMICTWLQYSTIHCSNNYVLRKIMKHFFSLKRLHYGTTILNFATYISMDCHLSDQHSKILVWDYLCICVANNLFNIWIKKTWETYMCGKKVQYQQNISVVENKVGSNWYRFIPDNLQLMLLI